MLTTSEAGKRLGRSAVTVERLCRRGIIKSYRIESERGGRGQYRIKLKDLEAWIESRRHVPVEVTSRTRSVDADWDAAIKHVKGRG